MKRSTWLEKKDLAEALCLASREGVAGSTCTTPGPPRIRGDGQAETSMDLQTFADAAAALGPLPHSVTTRRRAVSASTTEGSPGDAREQLVDLGVLAKAPAIDEILAQYP